MLNFYLKEAYDYKLITRNKFISYSNHSLEIHNMSSGAMKFYKKFLSYGDCNNYIYIIIHILISKYIV